MEEEEERQALIAVVAIVTPTTNKQRCQIWSTCFVGKAVTVVALVVPVVVALATDMLVTMAVTVVVALGMLAPVVDGHGLLSCTVTGRPILPP